MADKLKTPIPGLTLVEDISTPPLTAVIAAVGECRTNGDVVGTK